MQQVYQRPKFSFLVLDYYNEDGARHCLESIKQNNLYNYPVIYLDNGAFDKDYPNKFYQEGLIDTLIRHKNGLGGGCGQTDLYRFAESEYVAFLQSDQILNHQLGEKEIDYFISLLNNGFDCIDLNGDQSQQGRWTDRAHIVKTDFINSLAPFPNGGPGKLHHLRWNENYLQEVFDKRGNKIAHIKPIVFIDNGRISIRENPDGSKWKHHPDTKQLWLISGPVKEQYIYPRFSSLEWKEVLESQKWQDGAIPEEEKPHSFHVWN